MQPIIFLDIDGVLNGEHNSSYGAIDAGNVACLNALVAQSHAQVVISSSWRSGGVYNLRQYLRDRGCQMEIIGTTPILMLSNNTRRQEIQQWLDLHPCESFVILDDDPGAELDGHSRLIRVDSRVGLQMSDVKRALEILNESGVPGEQINLPKAD